MNWTYYGQEIKVSEDGYFEATVDGRTNTKQTLSEIKEWIDKEIAANVKKIAISLPVCLVTRHKDDAYKAAPRLQVIRTVITGVNRQSGRTHRRGQLQGGSHTLTRKHGEKVALGPEAQESVAKWKAQVKA